MHAHTECLAKLYLVLKLLFRANISFLNGGHVLSTCLYVVIGRCVLTNEGDCTCVNVVGGDCPVGQEERKADRETGNLMQTKNL